MSKLERAKARIERDSKMSKLPEIEFHIPVRPYTPIDALNRHSAALGSPRYAELTSHADYNGHHVRVWWNDYKGYYIAEYTWDGRQVLARGSFADCLTAALREHERGALGSSASIHPRADDAAAIALCEATDSVCSGTIWREDPDSWQGKRIAGDWWTWRHQWAVESARDYANPRKLVKIFDWDLMQSAETQSAYEAALKAKHGSVYGG
jgi:hypothetical protein